MNDARLPFDAVPDVYERARPECPRQAFEDLFAYLGETRSSATPAVIEIGPGTGRQATGVLLGRGTMEPAACEGLITVLRAIIEAEFDGYAGRALVIALTFARRRSDADHG